MLFLYLFYLFTSLFIYDSVYSYVYLIIFYTSCATFQPDFLVQRCSESRLIWPNRCIKTRTCRCGAARAVPGCWPNGSSYTSCIYLMFSVSVNELIAKYCWSRRTSWTRCSRNWKMSGSWAWPNASNNGLNVLKIWKSWWKTRLQFIFGNMDGKETKHGHFRISMNFWRF